MVEYSRLQIGIQKARVYDLLDTEKCYGLESSVRSPFSRGSHSSSNTSSYDSMLLPVEGEHIVMKSEDCDKPLVISPASSIVTVITLTGYVCTFFFPRDMGSCVIMF